MMQDSIRKALLAGIGVVSFTREKLKKLIDELVEHGELSREQGKKVLDRLLSRADSERTELVDRVTREVERVLEKTPLATRGELRELKERLEALEAAARPAGTGEGNSSEPAP